MEELASERKSQDFSNNSRAKSRDDTESSSTDSTRQNIFDILGSNGAGVGGASDDSKQLRTSDSQKPVSKLLAENAELKRRIRDLEMRASRSPPASKFKDRSGMKAMEAKLARFEQINEGLLLRLQAFEERDGVMSPALPEVTLPGMRTPPPDRKVNTMFKHGTLTFSPAGWLHCRAPQLNFEKPILTFNRLELYVLTI